MLSNENKYKKHPKDPTSALECCMNAMLLWLAYIATSDGEQHSASSWIGSVWMHHCECCTSLAPSCQSVVQAAGQLFPLLPRSQAERE